MRKLWQFTALLMLVLFAPASGHCLSPAGGIFALLPSLEADADRSHAEHSENEPGHNESQHDCPTNSLPKSTLPVQVLAPAIPCEDMLAIFAFLQRLANEALLTEQASLPETDVDTTALTSSWIFTSRAALPARWPSELA